MKSELPLDGMFAAVRERLPGTGPVQDVRQRAFDDFARQGLPHRRIEQWRYTDLRTLLREVAPLASAPSDLALTRAAAALDMIGIKDTITLVLVDGFFVPRLSRLANLDTGVTVHSLRTTLEQDADPARGEVLTTDATDPMISLNAALATDGVLIDIAAAANPTRPIHIVHVATSDDAASVSRSRVTIGNKARLTLVESFVAADTANSYQVHDSIIISVGDSAELQHVRLMEDALDAANITTAEFRLGAKAKLNTFNLTRGGNLSRYQAFMTFAGEGAELATNGVNLLGGRRHGDTTLMVDHAAANCTSREVFRSVLDDRGHSVFQGRIVVRPNAQKTDGKMMTRALLLSDEAEMDNKPELEIFADDVTCGHGATTGALDESLLFYLRARGLPEKEAQGLLIAAFVGEAIESIVDDHLRELAVSVAERWLLKRD